MPNHPLARPPALDASRPPPLSLSVAADDAAAVAGLIQAAALTVPGGCRGILVGYDGFHAATVTVYSDTRLGAAIEAAAARLGVGVSCFVFSGRPGPVRPGAHLSVELPIVDTLRFRPAIRRLAQAVDGGCLALLVSSGRREWGSRASAVHCPGILRICPGPESGKDILDAAGYPSLVLRDHDPGVLSAHELLDAGARLGRALAFPEALWGPIATRRRDGPSP